MTPGSQGLGIPSVGGLRQFHISRIVSVTGTARIEHTWNPGPRPWQLVPNDEFESWENGAKRDIWLHALAASHGGESLNFSSICAGSVENYSQTIILIDHVSNIFRL